MAEPGGVPKIEPPNRSRVRIPPPDAQASVALTNSSSDESIKKETGRKARSRPYFVGLICKQLGCGDCRSGLHPLWVRIPPRPIPYFNWARSSMAERLSGQIFVAVFETAPTAGLEYMGERARKREVAGSIPALRRKLEVAQQKPLTNSSSGIRATMAVRAAHISKRSEQPLTNVRGSDKRHGDRLPVWESLIRPEMQVRILPPEVHAQPVRAWCNGSTTEKSRTINLVGLHLRYSRDPVRLPEWSTSL